MPEHDTAQLDEPERQALERYLDELERWNRRINLTTVSRADAWQRHVAESLHLLAVASPQQGSQLVDVGAGGGAPGIVVAVVRPDLEVALVEGDARKAAFLDHVAGLLSLGRATVLQRRAEELAADTAHAGRYDLAISRAAAPPPRLCRLALPLVRPGGRLAALVRDAQDAAAACSAVALDLGAATPVAAAADVLLVTKRPVPG